MATESQQTVLVVDDDARLRDLLCTVLTPLDCEIVQAGSGEEALTALLQRKVAVIVMDINMPGMGGFETAQLIREADEHGFDADHLSHRSGRRRRPGSGLRPGAVDFLLKPVSAGVLYAKVKALLELDRSFARLRSEAAKPARATNAGCPLRRDPAAGGVGAYPTAGEACHHLHRRQSRSGFAWRRPSSPSSARCSMPSVCSACRLHDNDWHDSFSHTGIGSNVGTAADVACRTPGRPDPRA